jgi:hypothetical protein
MNKKFQTTVLVVLLWLVPGALMAEESQDPRAHRYLWEMGQYLASLDQFSFQSNTWTEVERAGQWVDVGAVTDVFVRRPDGLRARRKGDRGPHDLYYDGQHVTLWSPTHNFYARSKAPDNLEAMLDYAVTELGLTVPMADILFGDSYTVFTENVAESHYLGLHSVGDTPCHHLAFKQKNGVEWQIWIEEGKYLVPRRFAIKHLDGARFTAVLHDWDVLTPLPVTLFQFVKPAGAVEIPFNAVKERDSQ